MIIAICNKVINKVDKTDKAQASKQWELLATAFENRDLSQVELASEINQGFAFCAQHHNRRVKENFIGAGYVALDFDHVEGGQDGVDALLALPMVEKHYSIFYNTPSSSQDNPRFRLVFELDRPVTNPAHYREYVLALIWKLGAVADKACQDPCRLFYGSKGSHPVVTGKVLPVMVLDAISLEYSSWQSGQEKEQEQQKRVASQGRTGSGKSKARYLEVMLNNTVAKLAAVAPGERHNETVRLAHLIGGYIAGEGLDENLAEQMLLSVFTGPGVDMQERVKAVRDGIESGKKKPLYIPETQKPKIKNKKELASYLYDIPLPDESSRPDDYYHDQDDRSMPFMLPSNEPGQEETEQVSNSGGDAKLCTFEPTDEGNALAFIELFGKEFLYCDAYGWLYYDGRCWQKECASAILDRKIVEALTRRRVAAVVSAPTNEQIVKCSVTSQARIGACVSRVLPKLTVSVSVFDSNPDLLNCKNGVIDLRTGDLTPHDPSQKFTYCVPVGYKPDADYTMWLDFLQAVVGDGIEVREYVKEAVGYSLTGHTKEECLFYLYGPTRSGKGTFTETLMQLLGKPLVSEVTFETFTASRDSSSQNFDLAPLKAARMLFASESERYQKLNPAKIKQMTGGNELYCAFKHHDMFGYRPQFKMWMSSNWPVNGDVDDDALWGRVRVISFPNSHLGREDKELKDKLKTPKVLEGVLAWAVEGAMQWYSTCGGLYVPKIVKEWTNENRTQTDFVAAWLEECTERDETVWTSNAKIMANFQDWCKENGHQPKSPKTLATSLSTKGYTPGVRGFDLNKQMRGVQGLKIINS